MLESDQPLARRPLEQSGMARQWLGLIGIACARNRAVVPLAHNLMRMLVLAPELLSGVPQVRQQRKLEKPRITAGGEASTAQPAAESKNSQPLG